VTTTTLVPAVQREDERRARLRQMKGRATALLALATVVFLALTLWGGDGTAATYGQAVAEAAMVGGLADWFAVTALFRHPLGIPIPHTAIIVARKDQFGETLGAFIQDAFLTPDAIVARLEAAQVGPRLAAWLRDPANADRVAGEVLDGAVQVADLIADDDVQRIVHGAVRARVESVPVAPMAGRVLEFLIRDGRHQQVLDTGLRELDRYVEEHRADLRAQLGEASPWWLPGAAEDRLFDRLIEGLRTLVQAMLADEQHQLRRRFETRLATLAEELQTSPELRARGEQLKAELLSQPEIGQWVDALWQDAKAQLREQATRPDGELRHRLAEVVVSVGERLDEPAMADRVDEALTTAVAYVVDRFHGEIVNLVSGTIERWDAAETADRLELLLGPDLQFIRINGTVVGAMAGLVLHTVADILG
jgi:uncharacterized membrane-anchored protein YjiN (DUF445 family)